MWHGHTTSPRHRKTIRSGDWAGDGMWQKGNGTWDGKGGRKRQATAPWDRETSRHGVINYGPTMGSLATGSRENTLNSGTAVRCPQG